MATIVIPQTSGIVTIDSSLGAKPGDIIVLQTGDYDALTISGINGTSTQRITLNCLGAVVSHPGFTTSIANCSFLTINNLGYLNQGGYGMEFRSLLHSVYFNNFMYTNIGSYAFNIANNFSQVWDGTPNTAFTDIRFTNLTFNKCPAGAFFQFGYTTESDMKDVFLDPVFSNISFDTCGTSKTAGEFIRFLGYNYSISNISNVNSFLGATDTSGVGHNSLIYVRGYGSISNIESVNDWGNMIRSYASKTSFAGYTSGQVRIWNIIARDKRKYAPLSIEQIVNTTNPRVSKGNTDINYVTAVNLSALDEPNNRSRIVDAYDSNITINNSVVCNPAPVFDPNLSNVYIMEPKTTGLTNLVIGSNNKSFASSDGILKDPANDDYTPIGPLVNNGVMVGYAGLDYLGNKRPQQVLPDIGAVEAMRTFTTTTTTTSSTTTQRYIIEVDILFSDGTKQVVK